MEQQQSLTRSLIEAGALFHQRGWVPATGGNFSARLDEAKLLITASGCHKGELTADDFLLTDLHGTPATPDRPTSYETQLHCQLYRFSPQIGAVFHTHSLANTVLSRHHDTIRLSGYELLKVLPGISSHAATGEIPVFENDQDIQRLAARVDEQMRRTPEMAAYLIAGHGLYAWGESVAKARWRIEALEFMLECELRSRLYLGDKSCAN